MALIFFASTPATSPDVSILYILELSRYYIRKNRQSALKLLATFLKVEVRLALSIMLECLDVATDTIFLLKNVLQTKPEHQVRSMPC